MTACEVLAWNSRHPVVLVFAKSAQDAGGMLGRGWRGRGKEEEEDAHERIEGRTRENRRKRREEELEHENAKAQHTKMQWIKFFRKAKTDTKGNVKLRTEAIKALKKGTRAA